MMGLENRTKKRLYPESNTGGPCGVPCISGVEWTSHKIFLTLSETSVVKRGVTIIALFVLLLEEPTIIPTGYQERSLRTSGRASA